MSIMSASEEVLPTIETPITKQPNRPSRFTRRAVLEIIAGFLLVLALMVKVQFAGPAILDNDGYYHIRWSKMIRESAPHLPKFKWLPLTTLDGDDYVDHHFLFHILLIPFTFGDLRVGAKLAAPIFCSFAMAALFGLLVVYRVPYRWAWLAPLVASSEPFLYRMSMTRAPSLSLALLAVGAYLILTRRTLLLAVLGFVFVWLYSLFPLILVFSVAYSIAVYLAERRIDLRAVWASASGIVMGLIINPYFPENLKLFKEHLLMKTSSSFSVDVGVEWYPYDTWVLLGGSAVAFVIYFAAILAFDYRRRIEDLKPLFFLIISVLLLLMSLKSRRFIEYWPPIAVLFAAFTIRPDWTAVRRWFVNVRDRAIASLAAAVVTVSLLLGLAYNVVQTSEDMKSEDSPYQFKGAGEWLAANTQPGSIVFNTNWDEFPMLFYYDTNNTYIVGLDPTYLFDRDHELWNVYASVTLGNEEDPAPIIRDRFSCNYVVTDNEHTDFMDAANNSGDFETVYADQYATVLRVHGAAEPKANQDDTDSR
jgi:hypothetical protein